MNETDRMSNSCVNIVEMTLSGTGTELLLDEGEE